LFYPFHDVLELLEDHYGYDVESVAHKGDPIEEMAYGGNQLEELTRRIEKLLRRGLKPKAILLSGGGNDVAGKEFGMLLNHANSAVAGLNSKILEGVIDTRIRTAYITILSAITQVCQEKLSGTIPIIVHGYDYPVPDGRGFMGGWWLLPGPWLEPGFREKGYQVLDRRKELAREFIDKFNEMLKNVVALAPFSHVRYIDLRGALSTDDKDYEDWWANELHPTPKGFARITDRFVAELKNFP
jgi:lysophospholipase L1-like esterase